MQDRRQHVLVEIAAVTTHTVGPAVGAPASAAATGIAPAPSATTWAYWHSARIAAATSATDTTAVASISSRTSGHISSSTLGAPTPEMNDGITGTVTGAPA
ncbi:MAG: hypothetical protein SH820_04815 [Xanthomonadales bacterium]|nr:hypothetical protein [Xanthomonadales bacterium]